MNHKYVFIYNLDTIQSWSDLLRSAIQSDDWKQRYAGYSFLSHISEAWSKLFKENLDEMIRMVANGVVDGHPRVKHIGLECFALFIKDQTPHIQRIYHSEIIPQWLSIMKNESFLKIKSISASTLVNFLKGMWDYGDDDADDSCKSVDIIELYWDEVLSLWRDIISESILHLDNIHMKELATECLAIISLMTILMNK